MLIHLIDVLYMMLNALAADHPGVHVVDCRRTLTRVTDWADEIHGTDDGFARVAQKFRETLDSALGGVA